MVFNLEEDREGLSMSTLFATLVLFELDETLKADIQSSSFYSLLDLMDLLVK